MSPPRTRFAPSPTGLLHLGNVRIAVFNWLFARSGGGQFVLRVEDTDTARNEDGSEATILDDLRWLGLEWDEGPDRSGPFGPYRQSERAHVYREAVDTLLASGQAFHAVGGRDEDTPWRRLTPDEAVEHRVRGEATHVRFAAPDTGNISIIDEVRGAISFSADEIDDFVLVREDGRPTYHFAVVVDDLRMEITHVIRGAGHLSNTPKHALLFDALGGQRPAFIHLPTVLGEDRKKLSKRSGAAAVAELREEGIVPAAIVNHLSLLGWSSPDGEEVLVPDRLVQLVSVDRIDASDTIFDPVKLRWLSAQHIRALPVSELAAEALDRSPTAATLDADALVLAVEAVRHRIQTLGELEAELAVFGPSEIDLAAGRAELTGDPEVRGLLSAAAGALESREDWTPETVEETLREVARREGVGVGKLFRPVRQAVTGRGSGPGVGAILTVVGRVQVLERLRSVAANL